MLEHALDEIETRPRTDFGQRAADALLASDFAQQLNDRLRKAARTAFRKARKFLEETAFDTDHGPAPCGGSHEASRGVLQHGETTCRDTPPRRRGTSAPTA